MVEVAEMNDVRAEVLKHAYECSFQGSMHVTVLMVRHVHSPYSDGGGDLIWLISLGDIRLPGEFFSGKNPDFMPLPDQLMAQSLGVDFGAGAISRRIPMNYLQYLH